MLASGARNHVECLSNESVAELVSGRVAPNERVAMETHIASCASCQRRVTDAALAGPADLAADPTLAAIVSPPPDGDAGVHYTPGEVIANRYQIIRRIGDGGQSVVYEAYDVELEARIALKAIRGDSLRQERMTREVQIARRLNHPNVARVFDLTRDQDRAFVTMEYIEGRSLAEHIRDRAMTPEDVWRWTNELVDAVVAIHAENVLHRDLKPANVLVRSETRAIAIIDFGLARDVDVSPRPSSVIVGTPTYWAPELATGVAPNVRSDLYALGRTIMDMLSGLDGDVDARVPRFVEKCLRPFEKDRFLSAKEAQAALRARPPRAVARAWVLLGLAVAVLALAAYAAIPRPVPTATALPSAATTTPPPTTPLAVQPAPTGTQWVVVPSGGAVQPSQTPTEMPATHAPRRSAPRQVPRTQGRVTSGEAPTAVQPTGTAAPTPRDPRRVPVIR